MQTAIRPPIPPAAVKVFVGRRKPLMTVRPVGPLVASAGGLAPLSCWRFVEPHLNLGVLVPTATEVFVAWGDGRKLYYANVIRLISYGRAEDPNKRSFIEACPDEQVRRLMEDLIMQNNRVFETSSEWYNFFEADFWTPG